MGNTLKQKPVNIKTTIQGHFALFLNCKYLFFQKND